MQWLLLFLVVTTRLTIVLDIGEVIWIANGRWMAEVVMRWWRRAFPFQGCSAPRIHGRSLAVEQGVQQHQTRDEQSKPEDASTHGG